MRPNFNSKGWVRNLAHESWAMAPVFIQFQHLLLPPLLNDLLTPNCSREKVGKKRKAGGFQLDRHYDALFCVGWGFVVI